MENDEDIQLDESPKDPGSQVRLIPGRNVAFADYQNECPGIKRPPHLLEGSILHK